MPWLDGSIRAQNHEKVLIIGSGGREHAIVWAIHKHFTRQLRFLRPRQCWDRTDSADCPCARRRSCGSSQSLSRQKTLI